MTHKKLIITEKPSVAQEFARILGVSGRNDGYIENSDYVITWCVGHLVEMVYPEVYDEKYKKWKLEDLPFLPKDYKYDVIPAVSRQYDVVHKMLHREDIDTVYWAGDAGKEGQTIEENIRMFGGVREGMKELRVWIDSQTEEEIKRGIREAKPMSDYANLGKSGIMRTIEDYAMGINFSRAMSVKYGNLLNDAAGTRSYTAIAVGRVMTCVLGMVVRREREIREFVKTPFYRVLNSMEFEGLTIEGEWRAVPGSKYFGTPKLYKENGFREKKDAQELINWMKSLEPQEAAVMSVERKQEKKNPPLLYNLAELQNDCSKLFKISPDETLRVVQELYEKKMVTYPRTDARVLSSAVAKEISKNISGLKGINMVRPFAEEILEKESYKQIAKTRYVNDKMITDHYAIIPTGQGLGAMRGLNPVSLKVYETIVRRFLAIFYEPAIYKKVSLTMGMETERFFASFKVLADPGYLKVMEYSFRKKKTEDTTSQNDADSNEKSGDAHLLEQIAKIKKGMTLPVKSYAIKEGETSPPKRYNSGSMILAMENAGQLIEDEELRAQIKGSGIGTSATRAEILKKLVNNKYLSLNKKTQIITPTLQGELIYDTVSASIKSLLNPELTASWEKGLNYVAEGTITPEEYMTKLTHFIQSRTSGVLGLRNQYIIKDSFERVAPFYKKSR